jgi:hypothetical protein
VIAHGDFVRSTANWGSIASYPEITFDWRDCHGVYPLFRVRWQAQAAGHAQYSSTVKGAEERKIYFLVENLGLEWKTV